MGSSAVYSLNSDACVSDIHFSFSALSGNNADSVLLSVKMCKWKLMREFVLTPQTVNDFSLFIRRRKLMCLFCHFLFFCCYYWYLIQTAPSMKNDGGCWHVRWERSLFLVNQAGTPGLHIAWCYCEIPSSPLSPRVLNSILTAVPHTPSATADVSHCSDFKKWQELHFSINTNTLCNSH